MFIDSKSNSWITVNTSLVQYLAVQYDQLKEVYHLMACFGSKGSYLEGNCLELAQAASLEEIEKLKRQIISEINQHD